MAVVALAIAAADARIHFSMAVLVGLALWGFGYLAGWWFSRRRMMRPAGV